MRRDGAIFFDLDGTIADSGAGILASLGAVLGARGLGGLTAEEKRLVVGPALAVTVPVLLTARGADPSLAGALVEEYRRHYIEEHLGRTRAFPHMIDVLGTLAARGPLGIVTAKPIDQARLAVAAMGIGSLLTTVVGPHPDVPEPKAALLGRALDDVAAATGGPCDPAACWMVGDRHHDIEAAVATGMPSVGVLWGHGDAAELVAAGAHRLVGDPAELLGVLSGP